MKIIRFDIEKYPFQQLISRYLEAEKLDMLETGENGTMEAHFSIYKNMEQSLYYRRLYDKLQSEEGQEFYRLYEQFIREVIRPLYGEPVFYQQKPTHRINFRNVKGEERYHKDTDYGHQEAEINYCIPQSPAFAENTIWIESEPHKGDYQPMNMVPGEMAEFKGSLLQHGTKVNTTGRTRVSFDFRIIPSSAAPEGFQERMKRKEQESRPDQKPDPHLFSYCA